MSETPIKLLHTADLHLDSPLRSLALRDTRLRDAVATASRAALGRMVEFALEEGVSALLIAGDLFDGAQHSARTAAFLVQAFDRLAGAGIRVFAIRGNHDARNPVSGSFGMPSNVHLFDGRGGKVELPGTGIWIHGVSFRDRHAPDSLLPRFSAPVAGAVNIGLLHTSLSGASGHDPYAPCSVADLVAHGFDYWALGHVHTRKVHATVPFVVMPGMPQGRDIGESGPKSATLIEVSGGALSVSEVPTSVVEFLPSACEIGGIEDDEGLRAALRRHLHDLAAAVGSDSAILRLRLTGDTARAWPIRRDADLWHRVCADLAEETGRLWLEKLEIDVTPSGAATEQGAEAELQALMSAIRKEPGFQTEADALVADVLGQIKPQLSPDARDRLTGDEAAQKTLARALAEDGATLIAARLRGADG